MECRLPEPKLSLENAVRAHLPMLYRVAKRMTRNATAAEDLVGQVLFKVARAWDSFEGTHYGNWMVAILRNEFLQANRLKERRPMETTLEDNLSHGEDIVSSETLRGVEQNLLYEGIATLPEDFRWVLVLCDIEEMNYQDVSESLQIPVGTVSSRLFRARKMLRNFLLQNGMWETPS